jgi:type I restriction enzyme S subunit
MYKIVCLVELEKEKIIELGRGKIISKKELQKRPGNYPVYSLSKVDSGKFGSYEDYMFDEELITWSVDGGGRLFHRKKHKFSITNVAGFLRILRQETLNYKYLYYVLTYLHSKIKFDWIKKAHPSVLRKEYKQIPLPSLIEQHSIVDKIDKMFAEIDEIELKVKNQVDLSKKLFTNYLNLIFQKSKFKSFKLGDVPSVHSGGTPTTTNKKYWSGTIPWYSSKELNDHYTKNSVKKITQLGLDKSNAKIFPKNTLLIGIYDTAAMKMSILHQKGAFNQAIVGVPPNSKFETEYLYYVLNYLKDSILLERRGVRQMNLSLSKIKNIELPKPSLEEQKTIVYRCHEIRKQSENLKNIYSKKIYYLKLLKKCLLANIYSTNWAA